MSEAAARIAELEKRVMWRKRLLSLQDSLALAIIVGGLITAGLVALVRLRTVRLPLWAVIAGMLGVSFAVALTRWFLTRAHERDAAFLIDESLRLEDRIVTSHLIIERGGPKRALEAALIEDAAERVRNQRAAAVVPFRMRRWHSLALASLVGLVVVLMIPPQALPVSDALAAERADIEKAAEHLEQTGAEVEQIVPPRSETATLAREQAELGRVLRRSTASRADVLKKLSSLEERIRLRRADLAGTHADEIVSLADRRFGDALSTLSRTRHTKRDSNEGEALTQMEGPNEDVTREPTKGNRAALDSSSGKLSDSVPQNVGKLQSSALGNQATDKGDRSNTEGRRETGQKEAEPQTQPPQPVSGHQAKTTPANNTRVSASEPRAVHGESKDQRPTDLNSDVQKAIEQKKADEDKGNEGPNESLASALDALKAVPDAVTEQAAKVVPTLSEELLKKAAELRAKELSPADVEKLRQAAESLSRELGRIAESKELQQALQEMARQIRPEQIERVARELGSQEQLKKELEAAGRLLMENQQAKEIAAGLAQLFARVRDKMNQRGNESNGQIKDEQALGGDFALRSGRGDGGKPSQNPQSGAETRRLSKGKESSLAGKRQRGSGGEYLYLQSKPDAGAARAPYSSAYPQYRREAERAVQRSQVPPSLRSVVRKYFDAINPDTKR